MDVVRVVLALVVVGCSAAATPVAPPAAESDAKADPHFWRPIESPPSHGINHTVLQDGLLVTDHGGWRWKIPWQGEATRAAAPDPVAMTRLMHDAHAGLVGISRHGAIYQAAGVLLPFERRGELPGANRSPWLGGGALFVRTSSALMRSMDLHTFAPLPRFEGRQPIDAHLDVDGRGMVLFTPQAMARTSDGGKTYQRIDAGVEAMKTLPDEPHQRRQPQAKRRINAIRALVLGGGALDGDTVITHVARQPLGEAATSVERRCAGPVRACEGRVAQLCDGEVSIDGEPVATRGVNGSVRAIAFASRDAVVGLADNRVVGLTGADVAITVPNRIEALYGVCDDDAPVWALARKSATMIDLASGKTQTFATVVNDKTLIGFDERGFPVWRLPFAMATIRNGVSRIARLPFNPLDAPAWLGSLRMGRGMLLDRKKRAHLTHDGGRTWRRIDTPPLHGLKTHARVLGKPL